MNSFPLSRLVMGAALASTLITAAAQAQTGAAVSSPAAGQTPAAAIPFRPIRLLDRFGRPLSPRTKVQPDPDRPPITVAEYERALNQIEARANAVGDSLTNRPDALSTQDEQRWRQIDAQNANPAVVRKRSEAEVKADPPTSTVSHTVEAATISGNGVSAPRKVEKIYNWNYRKGDRSQAAIEVVGSATFRAASNLAELDANLVADAYLRDRKIPILGVDYQSDGPASGPGRTIAKVRVGKSTKVSRDKTGSFLSSDLPLAEWPLTTADESEVEIRYSFWGVPIVAKAGIEGTVGLKLRGDVRALGAGLGMVPSARVNAYAEAGVDVILVKFGIGGELTLLHYEVPITGYAEARIRQDRWGLKATVDISNRITAGNGRIYAYIKVPLIGRQKKTLVKWDTIFEWKGQLFKEEYWQFI